MLQGTRFQDQVLKPCKSIQNTSEEVLYFKTRQLVSIEKVVEACGPIASSIDGYLSRFMKLSFSELFFIQSVSMCLCFLFSQY